MFTQMGSPDVADLDVAQLWPAIEAAADQLGLGLAVIRIDATPPYVLHISERAAGMVGKNPAETVGTMPWADLAPDDGLRMRDLIAHRDPSKPFRMHVEAKRPDGVAVPLEIGVARISTKDNRVLSFGFLRDLTSEREVLEALQQSEQRFRSLVEVAPDGVVILRGGRIVFINPAAARLFGVPSPAAGLGRSLGELLPPDDARYATDRITSMLDTGGETAPHEYKVLADPDRVVEIKAIACLWEGQVAVLALARDVTERKALQAKLARADRLAALGTLAAGVAHEINNPLTYALLSLQRIQRELRNAAVPEATALAVRDLVANVQHGIGRVAAITASLRTFARADDAPPGPVEIAVVIERALAMVEHDLRQRALLVRKFTEVPLVTGNASRLEQVMVNVLLNAVQAIAVGTAQRIEVSIERVGEVVAVTVRDSGRGIPAHVKDRVFDPFFTTKPIGEGMGLGLAVCRGIVESIGGSIALDSAEGLGTTVVITLRVHPIEHAVPPPRPFPEPPARLADRSVELAPVAPPPGLASGSLTMPASSRARPRILLVDDDAFVRDTLARLLAQHYDVTVADEGEAAVALVEAHAFDAILCDVTMPFVSGREVYRRVAAVRPGLERRIVFITGGTLAPGLAEFLAATGNACVMKPFELEQILATVGAVARAT